MDQLVLLLFLWLLVWLPCGIGSAVLAANKGRNPFGWFVLGILFGLVALIVIAGLSRRHEGE